MSTNMQRLTIAASMVKDGRSMPVGDVLLEAEGNDTLTVTGWSRSNALEKITKQSALGELQEIKEIFQEMINVCPDLLELAGKQRVQVCLGFDYGMGAVRICSEADGQIIWDHNPAQ